MASKKRAAGDVPGPMCYEHWKEIPGAASATGATEVELFTDATITGDSPEGCGPYLLLNIVAEQRGECRPAIILRIETRERREPDFPDFEMFNETDTERYHGGGPTDEVAALVSLELGMRLRAGGNIRFFEAYGDPRGRPCPRLRRLEPILVCGIFGRVMPHLTGERHARCLNDLRLFQQLLQLAPRAASILVRAARMYENAIWVSEAEPHLSWLMLVSAVETAAQYWKTGRQSRVATLKEVKPELAKELEEVGGEAWVKRIAAEFAEGLKATKNFVDFLMAFLPDEPATRPIESARCPWDREKLEERLYVIYDHRSRALHGGTPFPQPMCDPPHGYASPNYSPPEIPFGEGHHTLGGTWTKKDLPMLLHTFEYIARGALLKWWESLLPTTEEEASA